MSEVDQMSMAEFHDWDLFISEFGPLHPHLRLDAAVGRAMLPFLKKGTKLKDLMPWPRDPDTVDAKDDLTKQIIETMKSVAGTGKKAKYRVRRKNG